MDPRLHCLDFISKSARGNLPSLHIVDFSTLEDPGENDTAVFAAMHLDPIKGKKESDGRLGTRASIRRDGMEIDAASLAFCPHEWINSSGYVDLELVRKFPPVLAF